MHAYFPALNSYPSLLGDMLADGINCLGFTWVIDLLQIYNRHLLRDGGRSENLEWRVVMRRAGDAGAVF